MNKNYSYDFIQIDSTPNIHLFRNGSTGSCCGNIHLKDFLASPDLKKIKTEYNFSDARTFVTKLKDSSVCRVCVEELYEHN